MRYKFACHGYKKALLLFQIACSAATKCVKQLKIYSHCPHVQNTHAFVWKTRTFFVLVETMANIKIFCFIWTVQLMVF